MPHAALGSAKPMPQACDIVVTALFRAGKEFEFLET
jgi:hypothetical protein